MVREEGFEPSRPYGLGILSPVRLPFRHSRMSQNHSPTREGPKTTGVIMLLNSLIVNTPTQEIGTHLCPSDCQLSNIINLCNGSKRFQKLPITSLRLILPKPSYSKVRWWGKDADSKLCTPILAATSSNHKDDLYLVTHAVAADAEENSAPSGKAYL